MKLIQSRRLHQKEASVKSRFWLDKWAFPLTIGFATQQPSATVTSGAYQALAETAEGAESFSEPSYVVVNETMKQFPATGGVFAETSLNSAGSSVV